jgi:uncharacterized protein (TIGR04255 family)
MTTLPTQRPDYLPDFQHPPLNEVVIGIQFAPAAGYMQILAGDIWKLFKKDFPTVEEMPALQPSFEVFGQIFQPLPNFGVIGQPTHDRFWFVSESRDELIQFQQDRLLHNWRKVGDETNEYPRFERMIERFYNEALTIEHYFNSIMPQRIMCNQAEISYVNHIPLVAEGAPARIDHWLKFLKFAEQVPDDASGYWRRALYDKNNEPIGRLTCEIMSILKPSVGPAVSLTLTVRGAPMESTIESSVDFLKFGRGIIVQEFAEITTDMAHKAWGRIR